MFKKILCPVDLKDLTEKQLAFARSFAKDQNATLTALYVTHPPLSAYGFLPLEELEQNWDRAAQEEFKEFCGNNIEILIGRGAVSDALRKAIVESGFDLIVMPTHGNRGTKELFLGSTFQSVVNSSTIPVLALPPIFMSGPRVEFERPKNILCAVDHPENSIRLLETAAYLAMEYKASWSTLHCIEVEEKFLDAIGFKKSQNIKEKIRENMRQQVQFPLRLDEAIVTTGAADKRIAHATIEKQFDLAVLGFIHSRLRVRTVLYRTILQMPIPCLCIPLV